MTFKIVKTTLFLILISGSISAQKFDKKFTEKFNTDNEVTIDINASNAEIEVTTWNKDQVSVEAIIEIEGLDKKEAEKYLNNWKFEALGNKSKVKINTNNEGFRSFGNDNFVFFNSSNSNSPNVFHINEEEIEIPELPEIEEIVIPEIDIPEIDIKEIISGLEHIEFDFDKYAKDGDSYFFQWKDGVNDITIKSKKEWKKFKKTKEYKKIKKEQEKRHKEIKKSIKEAKKVKINRKEIHEAIAKSRIELEKNRERIHKEIEAVRKGLRESKFRHSFSSKDNDFMINDKKVKVTKKIIVKVPKKAKFNLNTRHCKVKLPKTKASGKVNYGSFKADELNGGDLKIYFAPVDINKLNKSTLSLNNVTNANLALVTNTKLNSNSSGVKIENISENVIIVNKFGELNIINVISDYKTFNLKLDYSEAFVNMPNVKEQLSYTMDHKPAFYTNKLAKNFKTLAKEGKEISGSFIVISNNEKIKIEGKYSQLTIKK